MGNEPCGLEGAAKGAVKLVAADARLAGRHQEHRLQPMAHRYVACLEHGANLHSERLAALVALVSADPGGLPPILEMQSTPPQCGHTGPFGQTLASTKA